MSPRDACPHNKAEGRAWDTEAAWTDESPRQGIPRRAWRGMPGGRKRPASTLAPRFRSSGDSAGGGGRQICLWAPQGVPVLPASVGRPCPLSSPGQPAAPARPLVALASRLASAPCPSIQQERPVETGFPGCPGSTPEPWQELLAQSSPEAPGPPRWDTTRRARVSSMSPLKRH